MGSPQGLSLAGSFLYLRQERMEMFSFSINIEKLISIKAAILLTLVGFFLFWFSFQIPEPLGEGVYWISILTFSIGILIVIKKIIEKLN